MSNPIRDNRSREEVERVSRHCPYCSGNGMVIVFHPRHPAIGDIGFATEVSAHCQCDAGRWIRDRTSEELQARIPRVEDILAGRSKWSLDDPNETDEAAKITPRQIREMIAAKHIPKPVRTTADQIAQKLAERKESA